MTKKVFVDSDIIISSLISSKGAAHLLLKEQKGNFIISNISKKELEKVVKRLRLEQSQLQNLIKNSLKTVNLREEIRVIKEKFKGYTSDLNDTHIVAGAAKSKARFLLTYNIRHFSAQRIKEDFNITVLTPAQYLQYLRSLE